MSYVRRGQEQISIPHARDPAALQGAAADGHILAERIPVSADELRAFPAKRYVLRIATDDGVGIKDIVAPERRRPADHGVRMHQASFAELYIFSDHRVRPNPYARPQSRARRHHRLAMNLTESHFEFVSGFAAVTRSIILHISVASAASCPF